MHVFFCEMSGKETTNGLSADFHQHSEELPEADFYDELSSFEDYEEDWDECADYVDDANRRMMGDEFPDNF